MSEVIRDPRVLAVAVRVGEILEHTKIEAEAVVLIAEYVIDREDELLGASDGKAK